MLPVLPFRELRDKRRVLHTTLYSHIYTYTHSTLAYGYTCNICSYTKKNMHLISAEFIYTYREMLKSQYCTQCVEPRMKTKWLSLSEALSLINRASCGFTTHVRTYTHTHTKKQTSVLWLLQLIKPILCCGSMSVNLVYHS